MLFLGRFWNSAERAKLRLEKLKAIKNKAETANEEDIKIVFKIFRKAKTGNLPEQIPDVSKAAIETIKKLFEVRTDLVKIINDQIATHIDRRPLSKKDPSKNLNRIKNIIAKIKAIALDEEVKMIALLGLIKDLDIRGHSDLIALIATNPQIEKDRVYDDFPALRSKAVDILSSWDYSNGIWTKLLTDREQDIRMGAARFILSHHSEWNESTDNFFQKQGDFRTFFFHCALVNDAQIGLFTAFLFSSAERRKLFGHDLFKCAFENLDNRDERFKSRKIIVNLLDVDSNYVYNIENRFGRTVDSFHNANNLVDRLKAYETIADLATVGFAPAVRKVEQFATQLETLEINVQ